MKLLRVELYTSFRGLHEGFVIEFPNPRDTKRIDPICLVGPNGCGKSNFMEVLSEIFYYLESVLLTHGHKSLRNKKSFGFEIEYLLSKQIIDTLNIPDKSTFINCENAHVKIIKEKGNEPRFYIFNSCNESEELTKENRRRILPNKIIGYSSGMNELISAPFIKMRYHYFSEYLDDLDTQIYDFDFKSNKLFYMDYSSNSAIFITNCLMNDLNSIEPLTDTMHFMDLHSFRICININRYLSTDDYDSIINKLKKQSSKSLYKQKKESIVITKLIDDYIIKLMECATCYDDIKSGNSRKIILDYYVTNETKEAFKFHFKTSVELFKAFYLLDLLNLYLIPKEHRDKIRVSNDNRENKGTYYIENLPKPAYEDLIFRFDDIQILKNNGHYPIHYKKLSDGEHQFIQVIGAVLLMDEDNVLFLLDEPETHFNPQWRSKIVSTLNEITKVNENDRRNQEFIVTTHSPFILSDCFARSVFIFDRKKSKTCWRNPDIQTYGTSINILYDEVFKQGEISELAIQHIEDLKKEEINSIHDIEVLKQQAYDLGESTEKFYLINYLNKKKKEFENAEEKF